MLRVSTGLAALSVVAALTSPSSDATGTAIAVDTATDEPAFIAAAPTTTVAPVPPTTVVALPSPTTLAPSVRTPRSPAPAPPTTSAPVVQATTGRESCGWSWDATHFDDGSLNEVALVLDAPRRPNSPVTITAKPGASALQSFVTTTDAAGQATMLIRISNDKRDWTLTIGATFPGSSCDARSFTVTY